MRQGLITLISISICDNPRRYMKYPTFNPCWSLTSMQCVMLHASVVIKAKGSQDRYEAMPTPSSVAGIFSRAWTGVGKNELTNLLYWDFFKFVMERIYIQLPGCTHSLAIQYVQYDNSSSSSLLPSNLLFCYHATDQNGSITTLNSVTISLEYCLVCFKTDALPFP